MDSPPAFKKVEQLGSAHSFSAPDAAWPGDGWWRAYGDAQLDALIEEALRGSPDLDLAQARLHAAMAQVQGAHATRIPEVTGTAALTEEKQSYNYLIPKAALPQGWNDYGIATVNLAWELDFWGKNRAALAAAVSEQRAAQVEVAQTRLILSTSVASAYAGLVHLYTLRDNAADTLAIRTKTVALFRQRHDFGLETLASVRQVEARQSAAQGDLLAIDERIGLQRNAIAALARCRSRSGPRYYPSNRPVPRIPGIAPEPGAGASRTATRHHRSSVSDRSRGPAHRSGKGGLLPEREPARLRGPSVARYRQSHQVRLRCRKHRTGDFAAYLQHRTSPGPIAGRPCGVRSRGRHL